MDRQKTIPLVLPALGIQCPSCKSTDTGVIRTLLREDAVRRERKCVECGRRWYTVERTIGHLR